MVCTAQSLLFSRIGGRVVGAAKAAQRMVLRTALVSSEELRTIFAKTMGIINNFPIAYTIRSDMDFHYRALTPNHFLMGQPYAEGILISSSGGGELTTTGKVLLQADIAQNFGATPRQNRDLYHCLHIGLAFQTRLLSTKSGNIMDSGNGRIWGIDRHQHRRQKQRRRRATAATALLPSQ
jgi:hypothetical protein